MSDKIKEFLEIVKTLRSEEGCPWDRKQTHQSLIPYVLEETWEVIEEIYTGRTGDSLADELGDLLLQIALHSRIAEEEGRFCFNDVVESISKKMIRRHPHVFSQSDASMTEEQLRQQWQSIKSEEKKPRPIAEGIAEGIPETAPALMNALKISKRAVSLGFDWESPWDVLSKVEEELSEVRNEMNDQNRGNIERELGDLLFSIVNLARKYKINPEIALKKGNDKFTKRFSTVETAIASAAESGRELSLDEMKTLWEQAKSKENESGAQ